MTKFPALLAIGAFALLTACGDTPEQRYANNRDVECAGAALAGTVVGGALGSAIGGGTGRNIAMGAGALAGGAAAANYSDACR